MNDICRHRPSPILIKEKDWLKERAKKILEKFEGQITTSVVTFIELALLAKRYSLDAVKIFKSVMAACNFEDDRLLKAAIYI